MSRPFAILCRLWACFALALLSAGAGAVILPSTAYTATFNGTAVYTGSSPGLVCGEAIRIINLSYYSNTDYKLTPLLTDMTCRGMGPNGGAEVLLTINATGTACTANSTDVGGSCRCNTGFHEAGSTCEADIKDDLATFCTNGKNFKNTRKVFGQTGGSAPETTCLAIEPPFAGEETKGCLMNVGDSVVVPKSDGTRQWSSGNARYSGDTCTIANDPVLGEPKPSKEDKCPGGFEGTVNGVTKCVPSVPDSGVKGIKTTERDLANGDRERTVETTTCDGVNCTTRRETTTTTSTGSVSTAVTSVQGTLTDLCQRQPQNQVCQKTGQSGVAPGSTNGTGTGGGGSGQGNCGASKTEGCYVNVNEDGVETAAKFDDAKTAADAARDSAKALIDAAQTMQAPAWSFSFQLPTGCTSYQVATFKGTVFNLNPCPYQGTIHDLMSMIWAAATAFCLIGMVGRTIRES